MTAPSARYTDLDVALEHISAEPIVWIRLAATKRDQGNQGYGPWEQTMLDLVSGEAPPNWEPVDWRYPTVLIVATEQRGPTVAEWLKNSRVTLPGVDVELTESPQPLNWERRDSWSTYGSYQPLPWPVSTTNFGGSQSRGQDNGAGVLISDAAPSFLTYYAAASCVFNLANPIGGGRGVGAPTYRHQDKRGRINRVQIVEHSEFVRIELEGSALDGAVVELGGNVPGPLVR